MIATVAATSASHGKLVVTEPPLARSLAVSADSKPRGRRPGAAFTVRVTLFKPATAVTLFKPAIVDVDLNASTAQPQWRRGPGRGPPQPRPRAGLPQDNWRCPSRMLHESGPGSPTL